MEILKDYVKLSERSDEVDIKKDGEQVRKIIVELKQTVRENNLKSLSAIQIGEPKRIFVINYGGDIRTYINPIIAKGNKLYLAKETCSSIPDKTYIVPRYDSIIVVYQTPLGENTSLKLMGIAADTFQHEMDHIDGILLSDYALEIDDGFDKATDEEREEIIKMYIDSLDIRAKEAKEEIDKDEDKKRLYNGIRFVEKVQRGEVEFEKIEKKKTGRKKKDGRKW